MKGQRSRRVYWVRRRSVLGYLLSVWRWLAAGGGMSLDE